MYTNVCLNNKKSYVVYIMYIVKHNFILGGMCYYTKAQLHVSAIKVGHLQVVHENLSVGCTNVSGGGVNRMWEGGRCARSHQGKGHGLVYLGKSISIYSYV
jgi:hypothetical protein